MGCGYGYGRRCYFDLWELVYGDLLSVYTLEREDDDDDDGNDDDREGLTTTAKKRERELCSLVCSWD